jgi:hypothetical protein
MKSAASKPRSALEVIARGSGNSSHYSEHRKPLRMPVTRVGRASANRPDRISHQALAVMAKARLHPGTVAMEHCVGTGPPGWGVGAARRRAAGTSRPLPPDDGSQSRGRDVPR